MKLEEVIAKIRTYSDLKDGWYTRQGWPNQGRAATPTEIDNCVNSVRLMWGIGVRGVTPYAIGHGGVGIEWEVGPWSASVDCEFDRVALHTCDTSSPENSPLSIAAELSEFEREP